MIDRLSTLSAGRRLLGALDGLDRLHLVGGAVRDLLLERRPRELDLVAEQDGPAVARALADRLGGTITVHGAFGTATVDAGAELLLDVATARTERYPQPGALPVVAPGTLAEDMARRDFTVNAIAVGITADVRGAVTAFPGALEDLAAQRLRVMHDASFADDATRLIRLVRYGTRLRFGVHPRTEQLARVALAEGAPDTVGPARWVRELRLLLREEAAVDGLAELARLTSDVDGTQAWIPGAGVRLAFHAPTHRLVRELVPPDGSLEHAGLAALAAGLAPAARTAWLADAHVERPEVILDAARDPRGLAERMAAAPTPSALAAAVAGRSVEAIAVAGATGATGAQDAARRWLGELRHVRLAITGDDLLEAGVAQGPEIGRRLAAARAALLDGDAPTRAEQLRIALA